MKRQIALALIFGLASVIPVAATAATPTKKPVVATKKPVVAAKKPVVATKKPVVATKKPVVATKKPVVAKKYIPRKKVPVKPSESP